MGIGDQSFHSSLYHFSVFHFHFTIPPFSLSPFSIFISPFPFHLCDMITIISPAKTLDFDSTLPDVPTTDPDFVEDSTKLITKLRTISKPKLSKLMGISKDLAALNAQRYQDWSPTFTPDNSRPALLTFGGDVYRGFDTKSLNQGDLEFAQDHLRILSGLHGALRPLDRIQPYRLEMGTSLPVGRKKNLYQFWGDRVTDALNKAMEAAGTDTLINLASAEYFKVVDFSKVNGLVITPIFKDFKNGEYKVIMTWAKLARGMMAGYIVRNRLTDAESIKGFPEYSFNEPMSSDEEWVFTRQ